ncbi:WD repeat-containing protein 83 [Coemansia sp. BCRC 34301]|nr:WD repeat-containing protein 83 [Coemansia sp. BCRC 34301]
MAPQIRHKLEYHKGSVNSAVFDASGAYIFSGGQDKSIRLVNSATGEQIQAFIGHGWGVQGLAVSRDGSSLASCGGTDRAVYLWDVSQAKLTRKLADHSQRVDCVAISDNGSIVVSGSFDKTVRVWDTRSTSTPLALLQVLKESKDGISSLALTPTEIVASSIDGCVRTYDMRTGRVLVESFGGQPVVCARVVGGGKCLLVSSMDGSIQLVDRADGKAMAAFSGHVCKDYRIQCDASDSAVASGSEDGFVYVWDTLCDSESGSARYRLGGHSGIVNTVEFHPSAKSGSVKGHASMLSAASDGSIIVWE